MINYFIEVENEAVLRQVLLGVGVLLEQDGAQVSSDSVALDIIGTWYEQPMQYGVDPVAHPGFFANIRSANKIDWPSSVIQHQPRTPWREWT